MIEIRLGDRYAKSILVLATERKEVDAVHKDFKLIASICESNPDFVLMLKSPLISQAKKQAILNLVFKDNLSVITSNLIEIIVRKKREPYLVDITERFLALYDRQMNITRGMLVSAVPLTAAQKQAIKERVETELKTSFEVEEKIDAEMIGGFQLRIGDLLFDGSIASRLRELIQEFDNNPYEKQL